MEKAGTSKSNKYDNWKSRNTRNKEITPETNTAGNRPNNFEDSMQAVTSKLASASQVMGHQASRTRVAEPCRTASGPTDSSFCRLNRGSADDSSHRKKIKTDKNSEIDQSCADGPSLASGKFLRNIEANFMYRTSASVDFVRAAAQITERRLQEMRRGENRQRCVRPSRDVARDIRAKGRKASEDLTKADSFTDFIKRLPRRQALPCKPIRTSNLWAILRNSVGKDISSITIPVGFSEPISMLQRLAEDFEYSFLLDKAAACKDPLERLAIVSAFVISAYSSTSNRLAKPFNPLLGETYELDRRDDMGWRLMSEQVLHSPPTSAQFCESKSWRCWKTFSVATMFRGKYLKVIPSGMSHLALDCGSFITWGRVGSTLNNIFIGKMWLDNIGDIEVLDHSNGNKCLLNFLPFDSVNKAQQRRVKGTVVDTEGEARWLVNGRWDSYVEITPVSKTNDELAASAASEVVWRFSESSPEIDVFYNFSLFACQLNEPENLVAPTDSRQRQDIRLMEEGAWNEADVLKKKLEQANRDSLKSGGNSQPLWFTQANNPVTKLLIYLFNTTYWQTKAVGNWTMCPDIYAL